MPLTLPNTTLNLSTVDQLKAVYEYVVAELGLAEAPNPFTNGLLRQSDQDIAKLIHEVISANLVSVGCSTLPSFSIPDYDNDALVNVLIDQLNYSIAACNLGGDGGESTGLLLIPTGAIETADGEFQRFVPNATDPLGYPAYYAELDAADWQESPISVQFKWPALTVVNDALLIFFISGNYDSIANSVGGETDSIYAALQLACTEPEGGGQGEPYAVANFDFYKFGVEPPTSESVTLTPSAGDIATLTFTRTQMTLTVGGETQAYAIPAGIFTGVPLLNVAAKVESAVLPLSIKVSVTS